MIDSQRQPPKELFVLQRLLARLPENHEKVQSIQSKIYQMNAGYSGELVIDRVLREVGWPREYSIMKGLRIEVTPNFYVKLDTLIITRTCVILLEIKNYSGTVQFDEASGKTIKTSPNGEVDKFDCVVHQVDRAVHGLKTIIQQGRFPISFPIHPIIVMANQKTEVSQYPNSTPVKYGKQLPRYLRQYLNDNEMISPQEIHQLSNYLRSCSPNQKYIPVCERYTIPPKDLLRGVLCSHCNNVMRRSQGHTWKCEKCHKLSANAIDEAVADWFYLISQTITNKQLRHFLEIKSNSAASRILNNLKLRRLGASSNTFYTWDYRTPLRDGLSTIIHF